MQPDLIRLLIVNVESICINRFAMTFLERNINEFGNLVSVLMWFNKSISYDEAEEYPMMSSSVERKVRLMFKK